MSTKMKIPQAGSLLLSEPFMVDDNFKRSVLLICEHHLEGSVGFIVNKPLGLKLNDVLEDFPPFEADLHLGGPVQTDTLHYIHTLGDQIEGTVKVTDNLWWGGNFESVKALIQSGQAEPNDFRFFLGYSGWGEGQLVMELEENSWIVTDSKARHIFNDHPDGLWQTVMKEMGGQYSIMSNFPESPTLN